MSQPQPVPDNVIWMNEDQVPQEVLESTEVVSPDLAAALMNGAKTAGNFVYDNRRTIKNAALVSAGVGAVVYLMPAFFKALADSAHYGREVIHGRGYENRWNKD